MIQLADIQAAAQRIAPYIKRTPLEPSESLSRRLGVETYVKYEMFQKTGSFKARGAFNRLLSLTPDERKRGVVAVSGGNHAQAIAYAASKLGIRSVIAMPENTPQMYLDATIGYGAVIDLQPTIAAAFERIEHYTADGMVFVHPFDDELVMAGQGTVGLEILEDLPHTSDIVVSIGGGGLIAGVGVAAKSTDRNIRVWGVETVGADAMSHALAAGHPVNLGPITSIAKTLGAPAVTERSLAYAQKYVESVTVVPDAEAVECLVYIHDRLKVATEPAASCTLAAAERLRDNFGPDTRLVLVLCGGNTSAADVCSYI